MQYDFDIVAAASALGGAVIGGLGIAFKSGTKFERIEGEMRLIHEIMGRIEEKVDSLERRYNYDGEYATTRYRSPHYDNFSGGPKSVDGERRR